jgi:hypothetical protein
MNDREDRLPRDRNVLSLNDDKPIGQVQLLNLPQHLELRPIGSLELGKDIRLRRTKADLSECYQAAANSAGNPQLRVHHYPQFLLHSDLRCYRGFIP